MKKLICVDVDGTLVHGEYRITDEIRAKLDMTEGKFVIVSGRTIDELLQLETNYSLIGSNGGEIYHDGEFKQKLAISKEESIQIIDDMKKFGYYTIVHADNGRYIELSSEEQVGAELHKILTAAGTPSEMYRDRHSFMLNHIFGKSIKVDDLKQYVQENELFINKLESHFELDKTEIFKYLMDNYKVEAFNSAGSNIEIVPKGASKAAAINAFVGDDDYYIVAIGDGDNDISMFEIADYKIAMGNGTDKLKSLADIVVSEGQNGFIEALEIADKLDSKDLC